MDSKKNYTSLNDIKLSEEFFQFYKRLGDELKYSNRFNISPDLAKYIEKYLKFHEKRKCFYVAAGKKFYRARINANGQSDPYKMDEMGAPPRELARSGRINPEGISYLYLADSADTAIAEVRPWVGAKVSVAEFSIKRDIKVISLQHNKVSNVENYPIEDMVADVINSVPFNQYYFATPAHNNDSLAYLPSQYLAESFKNMKFDGLEYGSVLNKGGVNLALFNSSIAVCESINLYAVDEVLYSSSHIFP